MLVSTSGVQLNFEFSRLQYTHFEITIRGWWHDYTTNKRQCWWRSDVNKKKWKEKNEKKNCTRLSDKHQVSTSFTSSVVFISIFLRWWQRCRWSLRLKIAEKKYLDCKILKFQVDLQNIFFFSKKLWKISKIVAWLKLTHAITLVYLYYIRCGLQSIFIIFCYIHSSKNCSKNFFSCIFCYSFLSFIQQNFLWKQLRFPFHI